MKLVDANVLINATFSDRPDHPASARWLERAFNGTEVLALPWLSLLAFVRIVSSRQIFPHPLPVEEALDRVDSWLALSHVVSLHPADGHARDLSELLTYAGGVGNLVNDAHLAVIARQHRATVVSYDRDFGRFPGITWRTPEQLLQESQ